MHRCFLLGALTALALGLMVGHARAQSSITNFDVVLGYQVTADNVVLTSLGDTADPEAFVLSGADLWTVTLRDGSGSTIEVAPSTAPGGTFAISEVTAAFFATWTGVPVPGAPGETLDVEVFIQASPSRHFNAQILVDAALTTRSVHRVEFPRADLRVDTLELGAEGTPQAVSSGTLAYPLGGGVLVRDPATAPVASISGAGGANPEVVNYPGYLSMQWSAFYDEALAESGGPVFTFGARDGDGYYKRFPVVPTSSGGGVDGLRFGVVHVPEDNLATKIYQSTFLSTIGIVRGDWYDAAMDYKAWALQQSWTQQGAMRSNEAFSTKIRDADMLSVFSAGLIGATPVQGPAWEFGLPTPPGANCTPPKDTDSWDYWKRDLEDQLTYFDVDDIPMLVYFWEHNAFDANFGDWLPADAKYVTAAGTIDAAGYDHAPYFHNAVFSEDAPDFANAANVPGFTGPVSVFAVRDDDGSVPTFAYTYCDPDTLTQETSTHHPLCHACTPAVPGLNFTAEYAVSYLPTLQGSHLAKGIYLDTFSIGSSLCQSRNHGHPRGGGNHYNAAKRANAAQIRDEGDDTDPGFFMLTESQDETLLDRFEWTLANLANAPSADDDIERAPLFQAIYHEYFVSMPIFSMHGPDQVAAWDTPKAARELRSFYAENIHFGHAPSAGAMLDPMDFATARATYTSYATLPLMAKRFMVLLGQDQVRDPVRLGERLRDPRSTAPTIPAGVPGAFSPQHEPPAVFTSAWYDPTDDSVNILALNWTDPTDVVGGFTGGPVTYDFEFDLADYGLSPGTYERKEITGGLTISTLVPFSGTSYGETLTVGEKNARFIKYIPSP